MNGTLAHCLRRGTSSSRRTVVLFARNAHRHRTIDVQLTADVPGLGAFGSVQTVNPGRMRNQLFPSGLATYIRRGAAPKLLERPRDPNGPVVPEIDFAELELSLRELPELVFRRRVMRKVVSAEGPTSSGTQLGNSPAGRGDSAKSRVIYGSVAPGDVVQRLSDSHHITLLPPNALLEFNDGSIKFKSTGKHGVTVILRNGVKVPLTVAVEGDE